MGGRMRRAVFIDRDGVICHNQNNHVKSWEEFVFLPDALEALTRLARSDFYIIVITNQAIINRHMVSAEVVEDIHARMVQAIETAGGRVDRVMYCPHRPDEHCTCRKPQPGLLLKAAEELGLDLAHSYLIGDAESDMKAGRAAGCQRYLVLTGRGRRQLIDCWLHGERGIRVKSNLEAAVNAILRREDRVRRHFPHLACIGGGGS
jgi:D-glycero-D-manno-heptose 1,7-bisphosphate phosphatase